MPERLRVIEKHVASFPYSMVVKEGEEVDVGREDDEMPGWFWCTNSEGVSGWIPEDYIKIEGNKGRILVDYDTIEFTVEVGETLEYIKEAQGWAWCRDGEGRLGWVPLSKVEKIESTRAS